MHAYSESVSDVAIKIENLSKQYRLGVVGTGTLSHDLKRWWTVNMLGKEDPYLKIGETNDRSTKASSEYVWALKDINLEIRQGDVVGIIGKNGAGKSTLLKILSKVTKPTTGTVQYKGRIASLLEVGTGFHMEMTGRENIYMNGSIMGMTRAEITSKLDEIIDFAGVERFIDTPVKRYSSGMTVRLGFAIAAHLEPEILIVDEVLAVGDAEFQKKAIGKMQDVSKVFGRTVLFVSHNLASVKNLCCRGVLLNSGRIDIDGNIDTTIDKYLNQDDFAINNDDLENFKNRNGNGLIRFISYKILNDNYQNIDFAVSGQKVIIELDFLINSESQIPPLHFSLWFKDKDNNPYFHLSNTVANGAEFYFPENNTKNTVRCIISKLPLNEGMYYFDIYCGTYMQIFDNLPMAGKLNVVAGDYYKSGRLPYMNQSPILVENIWET